MKDTINFKYIAMAAGALASVILAHLFFDEDEYIEIVEPPKPVDDDADVVETTIETKEIDND